MVFLVWGLRLFCRLGLMVLFIFFPISLFLPFYLLSFSLSVLSFCSFYFCFKLLYERRSFLPLNCNKDKDIYNKQESTSLPKASFSKHFLSALKRKAGVFKSLWFKGVLVWLRFGVGLVWTGRPNQRNEAAFSNFFVAV